MLIEKADIVLVIFKLQHIVEALYYRNNRKYRKTSDLENYNL